MNNLEMMAELFKKYNLSYDKNNPESKQNDVYKHKHYTIITRQGIQKIEKQAGIKCTFTPISTACGKDFFTLKVEAIDKDGTTYETFASATAENSQNKYYPEMAEKRGRSRAILTLAGLYELGVYGADEMNEDTTQDVKQARYKGN